MSFVIIDGIGQEIAGPFETRDQAFSVQTYKQRQCKRSLFVVAALGARLAGPR